MWLATITSAIDDEKVITMKVNIETTSELGRKLIIELPEETLRSQVEQRFSKLQKTTKLQGFRPGKVPLSILRKRYGKTVEFEEANDLMRKSTAEALVEQKLQPAGHPLIDIEQEIQLGQPLIFSVKFEVYPDVNLKSFDKLTLQKIETEITEQDVDATLEKIREQHAQWNEVDRKAKKDDQVNIDFDGKIEGKPIEGGSAKDFDLVLGSDSMIPGFEKAIIGMKKGDETQASIKFSKDYHAKELAGKATIFIIRLHTVKEATLPELNDEFATTMGVKEGGLEALRQQVKENMQRELDNLLQKNLRDEVLKALCKANPVSLPEALVEAELEYRIQQAQPKDKARYKEFEDYLAKNKQQWREDAARRVHISLLFRTLMEQEKIALNEAKVDEKLMAFCNVYKQPEQMIQWYKNDDNSMAQIRSLVLEEQIIAHIVDKAKMKIKKLSFDKITQTGEK